MNTAKKLLILGGDKFAYRRLWLHTIHVATTGNDTTGNGSLTAPYLTLTKAMTVAVAGDGILVANGVYSENSSGQWIISKNLNSWLIIEPELGSVGDVVIKGTDGNFTSIFINEPSAFLKFRYLKFGSCVSGGGSFRIGSYTNNLYFDTCSFIKYTGDATTGLFFSPNTASNLTFKNCVFGSSNAAGNKGIWIDCNSTSSFTDTVFDHCIINGGNGSDSKGLYSTCINGGVTDITYDNCAFNGAFAIQAISCNGFVFNNCTAEDTNNGNCVQFGVDGTGTNNKTTTELNNFIITKNLSYNGHTLLFGVGCIDCVADNITISKSYDNGIVIKEAGTVEVKNSDVTGGGTSAIYIKGAINSNIHDNIFRVVTGKGFQTQVGSSGNKVQNWQFNNNTIYVSGTGKALSLGGDVDDAGGGICDYNTYQNNSGLGSVRNDADVQSLAELRAAWADYDVTTNDSNSTII